MIKKIFTFIVFLLVFVTLFIFSIIEIVYGLDLGFSSLVFFLIVLFAVLNIKLKFPEIFYVIFIFINILGAVILSVLGAYQISELLFRISLVFLLCYFLESVIKK